MKKNRLKQIIAGILVWVVIAVPVFSAEILEESNTTRANLKLVDMKYEHIEYKEIQSILDKLQGIDKSLKEEVLKCEEEFYELYCKVSTMIQISKLNYQLNTDKSKYFEEYLYSLDLLGKMKSAYAEAFTYEEENLSDELNEYYDLSIKRSKLVDEYTSKQTTLTIDVNGKKLELADLVKDTSLDSKEFEKLYDQWYTAYNKAVGEILLKLIKIDNQMAKIKGFETYAESAYKSYLREYSPEETKIFIANVKNTIPPIFKQLYMSNITADYLLQQYTYQNNDELLSAIDNGFISKHEKLQKAYEYMVNYELYDIDARNNKESGGFTTYIDQYLEPFMVLNYQSHYQTALTFIHEFGHYFSYYQIGANQGGLDLDETYSQALELLAMPYYSEIFKNDKYSKAAKVYTIESLLGAIIQGCLYEEFLNKIYMNPEITVEDMNQIYEELAKGYGLSVDNRSWCTVTHNFEMPYYYISYSISAVAAFEIWAKSLDQEERGMETYFKLVEAGKDYSFIESLKEAGLSSPFELKTLEDTVNSVQMYFGLKDKTSQEKKDKPSFFLP